MRNQVILITGCSTGIGYNAVLTLQKRGHRVIATCRKQSDVDRLISQGIESVQMDIASSQSIANGFSEILVKTNGRIDVLINNAGYTQVGALEDVCFDVLQEQFSTNVFGLMELTRLVIPIMRQQKKGRIINISSMFGVVYIPYHGAYVASKHALEGLSNTLRLELKPSKIKVITVQPGIIRSNLKENTLDYLLKKIDVENSHFHTQYLRMLGPFRRKKHRYFLTRGTQVVTKKLIHAIEANSPQIKYTVTSLAYVCILLKYVLSMKTFDRLMSYSTRKIQQTIYRAW